MVSRKKNLLLLREPSVSSVPPWFIFGRTRRGVTLLELLLAVGLVLALAAMTLPVMFRSLDERSFESAVDSVRNQLLLARAHAQSSRRPVEVRFEPEPPRIVARYFDAEADEATPLAQQSGVEDLLPLESEPVSEPPGTDALSIVESWSEYYLPERLWMARERPELVPASAGLLPPDARRDEALPSLRLAIYMPDGSALLAVESWLCDEDQRHGRCTINPFTGLALIERVRGELPEEPEEDEGDEEEQTEDEEPRFEEPGPEERPGQTVAETEDGAGEDDEDVEP